MRPPNVIIAIKVLRRFDYLLFDPRYESAKPPKVFYPSEVLKINEASLHDFVKANFIDKRVFVDMWATWCSPCK